MTERDSFSLLKQYLQAHTCINETDWKIVTDMATLQFIPKGQLLLKRGEIYDKHVFILKGCMRTFFLDDSGRETIILFKCEGDWVNERESTESNSPSRFNIEAIENTHMIAISHEDFLVLLEKLDGLKAHVNAILRDCFIASNQRIHSAFALTASEKYENMLMQYPSLILRIPQNMIASYLGISTETLSRIRNKTLKNRTQRLKKAV